MTDLLQNIQTMPLAGLVPVAVLLVAGIVLWAAGRQILRGAFVLMGVLLGLLIGLLVHDSWQPGLPGWVLPVIGGVVLAVVAAMTYRLAAAAMMAIVLGIGCPMSVLAVNQWQVERGRGVSAAGDDQIEVRDSISDKLQQHQETLNKAASEFSEAAREGEERLMAAASRRGLEEQTAAGIERVKTFGATVAQSIKQRWSETPKRLRPVMMLSALVGALTGLILGLLSRRFSDCAVTAMLGAALWLGAGYAIALRAGVPADSAWLPRSSAMWMGLWLIAAIIGLSIQWARRPRPADKAGH